jgi:hypothetical protein
MFVELPPPIKKGTGKVGTAGFSEITRHAIRVPYRELNDAVGLTEIARAVVTETGRGRNGRHGLFAQVCQSIFGRLGGYDDVNDADRLSLDPVMRWIVGGLAVTKRAASSSQMVRLGHRCVSFAYTVMLKAFGNSDFDDHKH